MQSAYIEWLQRHAVPLVEGAGIVWRPYEGALIPATAAPCFVSVTTDEARRLLKQSRSWLLRYSSDPCSQPTAWWYVVCDRYDPGSLSSKTRNEINRSRRECTVTRIESEWLAARGYACYRAAFGRYGGSTPVPESRWREDILRSSDGPFEYWGVFVGERLAGYGRCILEGDNVATSAIRLDPEHLKDRVSYALVSHLLASYVGEGGKTMSNGNRSVGHDTRFQEFLIKFGFRQQFCRLNIAYGGALRSAVGLMYPVRRGVLSVASGRRLQRLRTLLVQEEWRRASQGIRE